MEAQQCDGSESSPVHKRVRLSSLSPVGNQHSHGVINAVEDCTQGTADSGQNHVPDLLDTVDQQKASTSEERSTALCDQDNVQASAEKLLNGDAVLKHCTGDNESANSEELRAALSKPEDETTANENSHKLDFVSGVIHSCVGCQRLKTYDDNSSNVDDVSIKLARMGHESGVDPETAMVNGSRRTCVNTCSSLSLTKLRSTCSDTTILSHCENDLHFESGSVVQSCGLSLVNGGSVGMVSRSASENTSTEGQEGSDNNTILSHCESTCVESGYSRDSVAAISDGLTGTPGNNSVVTELQCASKGTSVEGQESTIFSHCEKGVWDEYSTDSKGDVKESGYTGKDIAKENEPCEGEAITSMETATPVHVGDNNEMVSKQECQNESRVCSEKFATVPKKLVEVEGMSPADVDKSDTGASCKNSGCNPVSGKRSVVYIHSDKYMQLCDAMIRIPGRACMVHRLIEAYGLLKYMSVVPPEELSREAVLQFHSEEYVQVLERLDREGEEGYDEQAQRCGLGYDCPAERGVYEYATSVAGATVTAAKCLMDGRCTVAINWCGGWHHAKKDEASGFCYLNDIVLGVLKLREKYQRVLYIDLDLHHGDGVEDAFCATTKVFTLSFHKYSAGFFPGTGSPDDVGVGKGRYFSLNIPLMDGVPDQQFFAIFSRVIEKVREVFAPEAVVCQCGADGLAGDPMNSFNLTHLSLGRCVYSLIQWNLPLLLLGGGGYNHANTARCWAFITSIAVSRKLPEDIPDHEYFMEYGPSYELAVTPGYRKNLNSSEYLRNVYRKVIGILRKTSKILAYNESV